MMRSARIFYAAGAAVLLLALLTGCAGSEKAEIYDREDLILAEGDSFTFAGRSQQSSGNGDVLIEYSRFSGIQTLWTIETGADGGIVVEYDSRVMGGNFKVIMVTADRDTVLIVENSGQGSVTVDGGPGICKIKIAGRNAMGELGLRLTPPPGSVITPQHND